MSDDCILNFIIKEIAQLDSITGETAQSIPVILQNSNHVVGQYVYNHNNKIKEYFTFSRFFFSNPAISKEKLIHVIKHEYCHFLNFHWYKQRGHGYWFQYCCNMFDCTPDKNVFSYFRNYI